MSRILAFTATVVAMLVFAMPSAEAAPPVFTHGVASGDVTQNRAILWTRVDRVAELKVEVWPNSSCLTSKRAYKKSHLLSSPASDFTVKVDARGLHPNTDYCYRFEAEDSEQHGQADGENDDVLSPVGIFRTAPRGREPASVAFTYTGDSDGTRVNGVPAFNNFEALDQARAENGNFFIYLGDTIYSDSSRRSSPATTLDEYRAAYKEARGYPALPSLLQSTSTYALMDDHEVVNDYDGQTVDPARYAAGRQAFLEYMPIRPSRLLHDPTCAGDPLYGDFKWGHDVELFVLDERSCRSGDVAPLCDGNPILPGVQPDLGPTVPNSLRTIPPFNFFLTAAPIAGCREAIFDPSRTMLGPAQKRRFKNDLEGSSAKYKFVISELAIQQFFALPYDRWEGYGAERNEIISFIRDEGLQNVVFLTTDNHANLVNQVFVDRFENCPTPPGPDAECADLHPPTTIANELVTGPIATDTFQAEVVNAFGFRGLFALNAVLNIAGLDCRNLNKYSYGLVQQEANAGTASVTLKDDMGAPVVNSVVPNVSCAKTFGP
jgi:alkaline phosphatase D